MNVLLTGGTGNLSSDCAIELLRLGHTVYTMSRGRSGSIPGTVSLNADRKSSSGMRRAVENHDLDVVIDFLGFIPEDISTICEVFRGRIAQLIFISSATVYRKPHRILPISEAHPTGNPFSKYAQDKLACEEALRSQVGLPWTIVRPSHTYSKKWIPNVVSSAGYSFVDRLERKLPVFVPDSGSTPWTLTASSDFAAGLCGLAGNLNAIGETFHITSDEHPSWREIYNMIAAAAGTGPADIVEIPTDFICSRFPELAGGIRGDKAEPAVFDNSRIKTFVPEFKCIKPLKSGLDEAISWMRNHPEDKNLRPAVNDTFDKVISTWKACS